MASTDPDAHFKCYISADTKIQAAIKHETEVKTIHRKTIQACRVYSGALDELTSQRSTGKCSSLLFLKFWHIVLKFLVVIRLVVVQDSVVIKTGNENLLLSYTLSVPSICGRMYQRNLSGRRLWLISDSHYLLLEYRPRKSWKLTPAPQNWIYSLSKY